ncbi:MAG: hypothetical protein CL578_06050 [Alteromonadaceae bacterium]|uniref:hypothetical protein n=1 Tax=uncultured Paraglaciecola sp. TaxID=1765024 RepID=UPI000C664E65|nr:hypothetical protein [Alteromonadaceae bacterium]|tara:strand:- start:64211 stop:64909 length:699 start_codon:yes stop_codon:yes gene_type:complete
MVNKTKPNKTLLVIGGMIAIGLSAVLIARELEEPAGKLPEKVNPPVAKASAPPPAPAKPTTIKDTYIAYIDAAPDKEKAAQNVRYTYDLPNQESAVQIAELNARRAKAEFEFSEWTKKMNDIRAGRKDSQIDQINALNKELTENQGSYYNRLRDRSNENASTEELPKKDKLELSEFSLMGVSEIAGNTSAHLLYQGNSYEVQNGYVLFGKVKINIVEQAVSICKGDECQDLH